MIRTTYSESVSNALVVIPYLREREIDSIIDAIADGDLIALADQGGTPGCGTIAALATPALVQSITARDSEAVEELARELAETRRELDSLNDIIGEVFAEDDPAAHRVRLEDAAYDVGRTLNYAIEQVEAM